MSRLDFSKFSHNLYASSKGSTVEVFGRLRPSLKGEPPTNLIIDGNRIASKEGGTFYR